MIQMLTDAIAHKNSIPCKNATVELALQEPQTRNRTEMAQMLTDAIEYKNYAPYKKAVVQKVKHEKIKESKQKTGLEGRSFCEIKGDL